MRDLDKLAKSAHRAKTISPLHNYVIFTLWISATEHPNGMTKDELFAAQSSRESILRMTPPRTRKAIGDAIFDLMNWPWQILESHSDLSVPALSHRAKNRYSLVVHNIVATRAEAKLLWHVYAHRNSEMSNSAAALKYTFSSSWENMNALRDHPKSTLQSLLDTEYLAKKTVSKFDDEIGETQKIVIYMPGPRLIPELRWIKFLKDLPSWG